MVGVEKIPETCMRWNSNEEILTYLSIANINQQAVRKKTIIRPKNGAMLFYDRTKVRYRADGYEWKKRKDGKNVREDHMKLKVNGIECLYGSYVHSEAVPNFHRRSYFKLKTPKIVLVHYLYVASEIISPPSSSQLQTAIGQLTNIFNVSEYELVQAVKGTEYINEFDSTRQEYLKKVAEQLFPARSNDGNTEVVKPGSEATQELLVVLDQKEADLTSQDITQTYKIVTQKDIKSKPKHISEDKNTQTEITTSSSLISPLISPSIPHTILNNTKLPSHKTQNQDMKELLVGVNNPILGANTLTPEPDSNLFSGTSGLQMPYDNKTSPHLSENRHFLDNDFFDPPLKAKDSKLFELDSLLFTSPPLSPQLELDPSLRLPDVTNSRPTEELLRVCDTSQDCPLLDTKENTLFKSDSTMSLDTISSSFFDNQFPQDTTVTLLEEDTPASRSKNTPTSQNENTPASRNEITLASRSEITPVQMNGNTPSDSHSTPSDPSHRPIQINAVSPDWAFTSGGEKILVVGGWGDLSDQHCIVLFGTTPVPAQHVQSGVIRVICPPAQHPGLVNINIAVNNVILTDTMSCFTYREQYCPSQWLNVGDSFKHSLINRLQILESQVSQLTQQHYTGDQQSTMCLIARHILSSTNTTMSAPVRGLRLIHLAAGLGYSRLVMTLLEFSSLSECSPSTLDEMGNNAVVWACVRGNVNVINILLSHSPHLASTTDGWGRSLRLVYTQHKQTQATQRMRKRDQHRGEAAARIIQLYYRTYKEKKKNAAAIRIQSRFRTYKQQCNFEQVRKAVVIIQQNYRCHMKQKEVAAKTIQRCWRQVRRPLSLRSNNLSYY